MKKVVLSSISNKSFEQTVACIGNFDGLHLGHKALIGKTIEEAKRLGVKAGAICFSPDPYDLITGNKQKHIIGDEAKMALFEMLGIDVVYVIKFNKQLMNLSPKKFISDYLNKMNLLELISGKDFSFGKKGKGDTKLLKECGDFKFKAIPEVKYAKQKVSSTRIKEALTRGDLSLASELLGNNYVMFLKVVKCTKMGKEWLLESKPLESNVMLPADGIYTKDVYIKKNKVYSVEKKKAYIGEPIGIMFNE